MIITEEFRKAVNNNNTRMVRIMLKDSLVVDPTFKQFNEMISIAEKNIIDLYDEHDGETLKYEVNSWTKDYMDEQMVQVVYNFSKKRITLLKSICGNLYKERAKKIERDVRSSGVKQVNRKKQVSTGLMIGGAVAVVAGVIAEAPVIVAVGATVTIAGGVVVLTNKK